MPDMMCQPGIVGRIEHFFEWFHSVMLRKQYGMTPVCQEQIAAVKKIVVVRQVSVAIVEPQMTSI